MLHKQVTIARIQTMADYSLRVVIDVIGGTPEDMKSLMELVSVDTTMVLAPTAILQQTIINAEAFIAGNRLKEEQ